MSTLLVSVPSHVFLHILKQYPIYVQVFPTQKILIYGITILSMATNLHVRDSGCVSLMTGEHAQKMLVVLRRRG